MQNEHIGGKMFQTMRILFHLCVSVSPMMVLHTQQIQGVRRDQVIAVSDIPKQQCYNINNIFMGQTAVCLGNRRPKCLADTERLLWKCILKVMTGSTGLVELSNFIQGYQQLAVSFSEREMEADWFSIARK
jgi:hypothetical protein